MSNSRRESYSDSSTKNNRSDLSGLRPLAPKARPIAPRPPSRRSSTASQPASLRTTPAVCAVCLKVDCQLVTHKAFSATVARHDSSVSEQNANTGKASDPGFAASYAFALAQQYTNKDAAASSVAPFYNLPIKPELNTPEMHGLFHDFFTTESYTTFRISRPPEIAGDVVLSPFFVPAMHDSALCLSILATAAAIIPTRSGMPARNIVSLTLVGESMQHMRERIEADPLEIPDVTIVAATFLWLVNVLLEDVDAINSHAASVVTFVTTRGGLHELGMVGAVAQFIRWTDLLSSLITAQPCRFLDETIPESEFTLAVLPQSGSFWLSPHTPLVGPIRPSVTASCQETCKLVDFLEVTTQEGISPRQYLYIVQKLCCVCTEDTMLLAKLSGTNTLDESISLAVQLVRITIFCANDYLRDVLARKSAISLSIALRFTATDPRFWQTDLDLLIWLFFSLLLAQSDFDGREWALGLLDQALISKLGHPAEWLSTWTVTISQVLRAFVWSDVLLAREFRTICKSIANAHGLVLEDF